MSEFSDSVSAALTAQQELTAAIEAFNADPNEVTAVELERALLAVEATSNESTTSLDAATQAAIEAQDAAAAALDDTAEQTGSGLDMTLPLQLTRTAGDDTHPRMAVDIQRNIWMTWQSTRTGIEEVYATKYFGNCGIWAVSGTGGEEIRISSFGQEGRRSMFPSVAISKDGEAHVVFQTQMSDGRWEIFYSHSTGGGASFTTPIRVTSSEGDSLMPDIVVIDQSDGVQKVVITWHDSRFGNFEIMSAQRTDGVWRATGQGGSDIRITNATGDSMYPRIAADFMGNIRVTYQDSRRGLGQVGIFMSTFVATSDQWNSSGSGGADRLISNSPADAFHPDISIDHTGGTAVAWHDLRNAEEDPAQHEEVYASYCPRLGHPGGTHFPPLAVNVEARLDVDFKLVDCVNFEEIELTNVPEVCLAIRAPGATFWRAANEDGEFTDWQQFRPNFDLETTVVPWTLTCVGGQKKICIQVQDAELVSFPICKTITLALQPPGFDIEFFQDENFTIPLPECDGVPVAKQGDVFVRMTSDVPQILTPTYSVISRGQHLVFNQETEAADIEGISGANSAGIGSFIGSTVDVPREDDVSPVARAFSAAIGRQFHSRFEVKKDDGLFHVDGNARFIAQGKDVCDDVKSAPSTQQLAGGLDVLEGPEPPPAPAEQTPESSPPAEYISVPDPPPQPSVPPVDTPPPSQPPPPIKPAFTKRTHADIEPPLDAQVENNLHWYIFSEGGQGYPLVDYRFQPPVPGSYAIINLFKLTQLRYDASGTPSASGVLLERAKILRMRAKILAMENPRPLIVELGRYWGPSGYNRVHLGEPLERFELAASNFTAWDPTSSFPHPRMPGDTGGTDPTASITEWRTIPLTTISFSGNTVLEASVAPGFNPNTILQIGDDKFNPIVYYIAFRESGPLDTDPPGRYAMYSNRYAVDVNRDCFDVPPQSTVRETWNNRQQISVSTSVFFQWFSYFELDFVFD